MSNAARLIEPTSSSSADLRARFRQFSKSSEREPWQVAAVEKLTNFVAFEPNWDGYGAPRIDQQVGMFALQVLKQIMSANVPVPALTPSSVGGVQIEWHENGFDLEVHIPEPYRAEVLMADRQTEQVEEFTLSDNFEILGQLMVRIQAQRHAG